MMKIAIVSTFLVAMAIAEPPVNSYLPPQARNNIPSRNYGAPAASARQPSRSYGAPTQNRNSFASAPRSSYGPPAQQQPSSNYGAPQQTGPSSNYGAPQQTAPSSSYGLPSAQDFNNFDSQRANSYQQAPSSNYGAPTADAASFSAPGYASGPSGAGGYSNGGYEEPAKYEFQYDVQDELAGLDFGHKEQREGSVATGRYYVLLPDGRKQIVNYIADENGYRPTITYEDTGRYNNNAQSGYDSNAQGFGGY